MQQDERIIPFSVMSSGTIFGIWGALNRAHSASPRVWHITSGARSIFLLPNISDTPSYKKLAKARNLKIPVPKELIDQGPVLAEISKHSNFTDRWHSEILFFPHIWLEEHAGEAWARFQLYLYTSAWEKTEYWRNKVVRNYIWDSFVKEFSKKNVRVSHYIFDIVEHLIMVALGVLPGFVAATDNSSAPIEAFQKDFLNIYGLKYYVPAIIVPAYIQHTKSKAVYWSMQFATYFESLPRPKATNSIVSDLREIIYLIDEFQKAVLAGKITSIIGTPFFELMKKIKFEFFHSNVSDDENIYHCNEMPKRDATLLEALCACENTQFSEISPFARGCVRISIEE